MNGRDDWFAAALPKTIVGFAIWLLAFAVGAALSGVIVFFNQQSRVASLEAELSVKEAELAQAEAKLKELQELSGTATSKPPAGSSEDEVTKLLERVGPSIASIDGRDASGAPTIGTGFVVHSQGGESWVLTNYHLVAGAIESNEPVHVRVGTSDRRTDRYIGDVSRDLAVIVVRAGGLPFLQLALGTQPAAGTKVAAVGVSAGRLGAASVQGKLIDSAPDGLLMDADIPSHMTGGPMLDQDGRVVGVMSVRYAPSGFPSSNRWAVPVRLACQEVLRCPR